MKKMWELLLVVIISALILTGCNENGITNEDSLKEAEIESVNLSVAEDTNADEAEIESLSDEANESEANTTEIKDAEEAIENVNEAEVPVEDSPIIPMDTIMFAQQDINVRSGPGTAYEKIGTLSVNEEVTVTGQDIDSGWYQIEYGEMVAFVSDEYLGKNKVTISAPANNADSSDNAENVVATPSANDGNQDTSTDNNSSSDDLFTGDDISNALQWHQQFQP